MKVSSLYKPAVGDYTAKMQLIEAQEYLPPEILLDDYHPSNQQYFQNLRSLEQCLVAASQDAGPRYTQVAKLKMRGTPNTEIAAELNLAAPTITNILKHKKTKKISALMYYLQNLREGPNLDQRKRTLWEICVDNKELDPKTSIAALQEMNRMDGVGKDKLDTKIEVTINTNLLPRGDLDT